MRLRFNDMIAPQAIFFEAACIWRLRYRRSDKARRFIFQMQIFFHWYEEIHLLHNSIRCVYGYNTPCVRLCQLKFIIYFGGVGMSIISDRLKTLRNQKGVTQKQIAEYLDIAPNSVQRFEYGTTRPSLDNLIALAEYYKVSLDYLVGRTDNPDSHKP